LEAISLLNYPRDRFEVIIVDDGGHLSLESVVNPFRKQLNLTLITQTNTGPAKARNIGVSKAKGQYIAFTDDDCQPDPDWLKTFEERFDLEPNSMLGGSTLNQIPNNLYSKASQLLIDYIYRYYNANYQKAGFFTSNNLALPVDKFLKTGCYDSTFPLAGGEDRDLCDRWLSNGYTMQYVPDAKIYHSHDLSLSDFLQQHFNYGRGAFHFHLLRTHRKQKNTKVEPFKFYFNLLMYPFVIENSGQSILISFLLFITQIANSIGFFYEKLIQWVLFMKKAK